MTASASPTLAKAHGRWQQLLVQEQQLQAAEALICVCNIRCSRAFWQSLHDRSEQLSHDRDACLKQLEASR